MTTLADLRDLGEQKLQGGDALGALKVFRLVLEAEPRDFRARLRIADCLLVSGETLLAGEVYTAVAVHSIKAGLPLQAIVAIKMIAGTLPMVKPLLRDLAEVYGKDSPVKGRGARAAPVDLSAQVRDDLDLDYPIDTAELLSSTAQMAAYTGNVSIPPVRVPPIPLFSELGADAFTRVVDALELRRSDDGEAVVRQNEPGDSLYVVAHGMIRVEQERGLGETVLLARLGEGSVFGEMSLLAQEPRNATVVVEGSADLLRFTREALDGIGGEFPEVGALLQRFATERAIRNLLATNPIFQPFEPAQRASLLQRFEAHKVPAGTTLVRQNEEGRGLYLILHGEASVTSAEPSGRPVELAKLSPGECFGEISMCQGRPTMATVTATRDSTIMFLPRESFLKLLRAVPALEEYFTDLSFQRLSEAKHRLETPRRPTNDDELVRV